MKTPIERFMRFAMPVPECGCWLWLGFTNPQTRYAEFGFAGKVVRAHRWSFEYHHRPLKPREVVCHRCDTPSCVNPDHLFAGSQVDNLLDAVAKGRKRSREKSPLYRGAVTPEIVVDIRQRRASGEKNRSIAKRHGISEGYCSGIARRLHWPEVA